MSTKLFVGNLPFKTTSDAIRNLFAQHGNVASVDIIMDRQTNRPRGFCFVSMATPEEAKIAAEKLNGAQLEGRNITVNEARPMERREGGGGGGGGGGGFRGGHGGGHGGGGGFRERGDRRDREEYGGGGGGRRFHRD